MLTTIAKRVQSRLSRQGIKVTLSEVKEQCSHLIVDIDNPTDEELTKVVEYFIFAASQLSVVDEESAPVVVTTEEAVTPAPGVEELDNQLDIQEHEETAPTGEELVKEIASEYSLVLPVDVAEELAQLPTKEEIRSGILAYIHEINSPTNEEHQEPGMITKQETSNLVANTAEEMGITLSLSEVTAIAEDFEYSSDNADNDLEEIRQAITAFVQHKAQITQQKITNIVSEVREAIHTMDAENSQLLNDGLRSISQDIKRGSDRFRQQTRQALKVFELPPSKAG